jgi:hypothetical protein
MSTCFVLMPFGGYFDAYYEHAIRPAIASAGLTAVRGDGIYSTRAIIDDIYRSILSSEVCVADVTGRNPNVSYELGMAHTAGKPVVIITQSLDDIPFDFKHLRAIGYDPRKMGWEKEFSQTLTRTLAEVRKRPDDHLALKPARSRDSVLQDHLRKIFFEVDCLIDKTDDMYCDSFGNALIKTVWKVTANSAVYHLCHNLVSERAGTIEVRRAYDRLSGRDLDHVVVDRGERHLSYMVLLKQFKQPGQTFIVETDVYAEGYLDGIQSKGEVTMSHQAADRSHIQYASKLERYHFPRAPEFEGLRAEIVSHPVRAAVGTTVHGVDVPDGILLEVRYAAAGPYRQETGAVLRCRGSV